MLAELKRKRAQAIADRRAILDTAQKENRETLTEDEEKLFAAFGEDVAKLDRQIAMVEEQERFEASLVGCIAGVDATPRAVGALISGPEPKREFESFGEFMHSVRFDQNDQRLDFHAEQNMGDGASGGFLVPKQFRGELLQFAPGVAVFRPRCRVIPAGDPPDAALTFPALDQSTNEHGGVTVAWTGEGARKTETTAAFKEITLEPKEVSARMIVTDKLLRNWQASGPILQRLIQEAMAKEEDKCFFNGSGVARPFGMYASSAALAHARETASSITIGDVCSMYAKLSDKNGAFWVCSPACLTKLMQLQLPTGGPAWLNSLREGEPASLLGLPLVVTGWVPTLGTKKDLTLTNGNDYLIKDGSGPFVATSEHVYFEYAKTVIRVLHNVDGQPWLNNTITLDNGGTVSSYVYLSDHVG